MICYQNAPVTLGEPLKMFLICHTAAEYAVALDKTEDSTQYQTTWSRKLAAWCERGLIGYEDVPRETLIGKEHVIMILTFSSFAHELKQELNEYFTNCVYVS